MKKIIVVGSKGFIGSYALDYFSSLPDVRCWGCDVVVDYTSENYFLLDASNSDFNELFTEVAFDVCINCSGAASVPDSLQHPLRDFTLNTANVAKMLESIRKHAPECKFINLSSAAIYGNPATLPINENASPQPLSPYGKHKLMAELLCQEYYEYFKINTCSLRIFSAYGAGLRKQLFWDISQKILSGTDLLLFGTGHETRDFIHVKDIVSIISLIITYGNFCGTCYNVANGEEVSIKQAAEILVENMNPNISIGFQGKNRLGDPLNWRADISAIKKLGYRQQVTIEQGLKEYAAWATEKK